MWQLGLKTNQEPIFFFCSRQKQKKILILYELLSRPAYGPHFSHDFLICWEGNNLHWYFSTLKHGFGRGSFLAPSNSSLISQLAWAITWAKLLIWFHTFMHLGHATELGYIKGDSCLLQSTSPKLSLPCPLSCLIHSPVCRYFLAAFKKFTWIMPHQTFCILPPLCLLSCCFSLMHEWMNGCYHPRYWAYLGLYVSMTVV